MPRTFPHLLLSGFVTNNEPILASNGDYELTGMNRGLKLHGYSYVRTSAGSPNWTVANTQTYGYDPALDYLTSTSYTDGLSPSSQTWTYDAAGNRTDTVADNLNRPITIGGVSSTSDILGNRLTLGTTTYNWDLLNWMTSLTNPAGTTNYVYRADGMRTFKSSPSTSTLYRYDGQMGMEDVTVTSGATTVTDYALGARGVDGISATTSSGTTVSYPIYDAHGNMVSTPTKNGTGYTYSSVRVFDPWGIIRSANSTGDPKGRYCANLGHKQDDESGLVYMRARYYEPTSGRFVNEDPSHRGANRFVYSINQPVNRADSDGNSWSDISQILWSLGMSALCTAAIAAVCCGAVEVAMVAAEAAMICLVGAFDQCDTLYGKEAGTAIAVCSELIWLTMGKTILMGAAEGGRAEPLATNAILAVAIYSLLVMAALEANDAEEQAGK